MTQTKTPDVLADLTGADHKDHLNDSMAATVVFTSCPECGSDDLYGIDYAWCPRCHWADEEAVAAHDQHTYDMTWGAI